MIKAAGTMRRKRKTWTAEEDATLTRLVKAGHSLEAIAREMDREVHTCRAHRKRLGLPTRGRI